MSWMYLNTVMTAEWLSWHHRNKQVSLAWVQNRTGTNTPNIGIYYYLNFGKIQNQQRERWIAIFKFNDWRSHASQAWKSVNLIQGYFNTKTGQTRHLKFIMIIFATINHRDISIGNCLHLWNTDNHPFFKNPLRNQPRYFWESSLPLQSRGGHEEDT
jgi:hypothetical protein